MRMNLMMIESALPTQPPSPMTSPNELKRPRELEFALEFCGNPEETIARQYIEALEARVALAQPEPEGPTDEALASFTAYFCRNYPGPDTIIHRPEWHAPKIFNAAVDAIARYARPAIQPVPVAEHPWEREGWCDAGGRCWWGRPSEELCNSDWYLATRAEVEEFCSDCMPIVSLPAHALPIPEPAPGP